MSRAGDRAGTLPPATNPKASIQYVCTLVAEIGVTSLSAEGLRCAKFGRPEGCSLWRPLHDLVILISAGLPEKCPRDALKRFWRAVEEERADNGVPREAKELVRSFLQTEGYARVGYWYQAGWPGSLGSREMLLAMAWIIVTWDVTAVALERRLAGWGTMGPLPPYAQELNTVLNEDSTCLPAIPNMAAVNKLSGWEACECLSQLCQMQWGVALSQTNHVASLQVSRARMRHRITQLQWELKLLAKQDNPSVTSKILSPYELSLATQPTALESHQKSMEKVMWMLQEDSAYAYHVNIFLKWLSSVLHEENVQGDINKCKEGTHPSTKLQAHLVGIERLAKLDTKACVEASQKIFSKAKAKLGPFSDRVLKNGGTHDAQIPHDHFTYFLKAVKQHMTTLALRDEEIGIQHIQSLPEDICCKVIKKPCSEANKILDKLHKYQCSSEVFLWLPPQETISGMGWINTTDRGVDQVANEINRIKGFLSGLSEQLADIRSMNRQKIRVILKPLSSDHIIIGV